MTRGAGQATRNLDIEVLSDLAMVEAIGPEWNRLAEARSAQPFALPGMAIAWWRWLGQGQLCVVTARNGQGELVGLAPLFRRTRARLTTVSFLGRGLGAVGELLVAPAKADIAGAIWSALDPSSTILDLGDYRHRGAGFEALRHHPDWAVHAELRDECPVLDLDGVDSVGEFLADPGRSGLRRKLARAHRDLASQQAALSVATDPQAVLEEWRRLLPLYDRAEAVNGRIHLGRAPYQDFFEAALSACAAAGQLAILTLSIGGRRAAFDVYVLSGSTASVVLGRFDPDLGEYSPGQLLAEHGVQWTIDTGHAVMDLQLGGDQYKRRWATGSYDTLGVVAAAPKRLARARATLGTIEVAYDMTRRLRP
ncbi:MAG: GNAT family N-acetyltransferase [Acidimicrobiales bacterium]